MSTINSVKVSFATGDDDKRAASNISIIVSDKFETTLASSNGFQSFGRFADGTTSPQLPLTLTSFTKDINTVIPGGRFSLDFEPEHIFLGSTDEWHIDSVEVEFGFTEGGSTTSHIPGRITMSRDSTSFSFGL
jgi:hypothetical protein